MAYRLSSDRQPGINTANERKTKKKKKKIKSAAEIAADGFIKKFLAEVKNIAKADKPKLPKLPKPDIKTRKDSIKYSGHSPGYPKTLDVNYAKDLAAQKRQKTKTLSASVHQKKKTSE